jgi:solute:Na+ symporter, SSS family
MSRLSVALVSLGLGSVASSSSASSVPKVLHAYNGTTPALDGVLSPGEWDDAVSFGNVENFNPQFDPVNPPAPGQPADYDVTVFVKRDSTRLYFAFNVTDDRLYRFQTPAWVPALNPSANNLTQKGWPWFGDEVEILLNPSNTWNATNQSVSGDGTSSQVVCNLAKSRLGGLGVGGLLEGEPRTSDYAWNNYRKWIETGAQVAATRAYEGAAPNGGNVYVIEWGISFNPCVEISKNVFYNASIQTEPVPIGLNIALGDVDDEDETHDSYGLRHEMWFNGTVGLHTNLCQFGTLILEPGNKPAA